MKDVTDPSVEAPDVTPIFDGQTAVLENEQEAARVQECPHCGHCPCGCGG